MELGPGGGELSDNTAKEDKERRALDKRKYLALSRRCKEIEQVSVGLFVRHKRRLECLTNQRLET